MKKIQLKHLQILILLIFAAFLFSSCKKFLDAKPDKQLVVPVTIEDAQALLDSYNRLNTFYPSAGSISDDDNYFTNTYFGSTTTAFQNLYLWNKDAVIDNEWNNMYAVVLSANIALETVNKIEPNSNNVKDWKRVKGTALFFRSYAFYHIAQYFAVPYDKATASSAPGIPLRLESDVNKPNVRSDLETTYRQITDDLQQAAELLPVAVAFLSRPGKAAGYGALARVYLSMQDYEKARKYVDSVLQISNTLLDYNKLDVNAAAPFPRFNSEVIFSSTVGGASPLNVTNWRTDTLLYQSYAANDLRKRLFFRTNGTGAATTYGFKGSYDGTTAGSLFNGLAVDEMYLIRAECFARAGNITAAMNDLNTLLVTRWKAGTFIPFTAANADDALAKILAERRKELIARGLRWFDLRRLNTDLRFARTLTRVINGVTYQLPPNDPRYTFYIPFGVVALSGMEQNSR